MQEFNKLDNPAWHSLSELHEEFALAYDHLKCYHPDYCPFGGLQPGISISPDLTGYAATTDNFFIIGDRPGLSGSLRLKQELVCHQMLTTEPVKAVRTESIIHLTAAHNNALYGLVTLVQPGYFKHQTALLGDYFGIIKDNELVAVTGERMKMNGFTEISAVITHPLYTGRGYAKQLVAHAVNNVLEQDKIPYLHVTENNMDAIKLYEKSGFITRRRISFWQIGQDA